MAGPMIESINPANGELLGRVSVSSADDYEAAAIKAVETAARWRLLPAPQRGLIVREIGEELRRQKDELGKLVTLETGKILAEGQRRSAGDDRHCRLRRWSVAAAARLDDA